MDGLVFDHEWALIHTNEEDLLRENSCSFVFIRGPQNREPRLNANGREFAALPRMAANFPRMWLNENVARLVRVSSSEGLTTFATREDGMKAAGGGVSNIRLKPNPLWKSGCGFSRRGCVPNQTKINPESFSKTALQTLPD
jgi:hypothetical protein